MNCIDRLTAILIQLQSKKIVKAQDIAERFNTSFRTVYRDIRSLEEAGVPIIGEAGVGYSIMEGYRLPPVMFTKEEATAFLTAEKLVEKFTDSSTTSGYKSAMFKVRAVLRSTEKDLLENIEDRIAVLRGVMPFSADSFDNTLQPLLRSISEKRVMHIRYSSFNSDEKTERDIEPLGVFYSGGYWHTIAFCRLRNDYRDFRTDRILKINTTDSSFDKEHPTLKKYLEEVAQKQNLEKIVISVKKETAKYLQGQKFYFGFVSEIPVEDCIEMTFLSASQDGFVRWYMMFADDAEIVYPSSLQKKFKDFVSKMAKKFL